MLVITPQRLDQLNQDPALDSLGKQTLWAAIQHLAQRLRKRHQLFVYYGSNDSTRIDEGLAQPSCEPWKMIELLSLLSILDGADSVTAAHVYNLCGRIDSPIAYMQAGVPHFLWTQTRIATSISGFLGIPDIVITTDTSPPSEGNALTVIECKSGKRIQGPMIRAEFGKAFDLRVATYFIWSYVEPRAAVIEGAQALGIDLSTIGLLTNARATLLSVDALIQRVQQVLVEAIANRRFENKIIATGLAVQDKTQRLLS